MFGWFKKQVPKSACDDPRLTEVVFKYRYAVYSNNFLDVILVENDVVKLTDKLVELKKKKVFVNRVELQLIKQLVHPEVPV